MFRKLRILSYHNIDDAPSQTSMPGLYVSQVEFARHMESLRRFGLRGVTLSEGLKRLRDGDQGRVVAITFDDGYRDNERYALPVLRDCGFAATCYLVSDRLGAYNDWDAEVPGARKPLMMEAEIHAWLAGGMEIGSHTRSHPRLDLMSDSDALAQLVESREALSKLAGRPVDHFCYPYGRYNHETPALVRRAGYVTATTTRAGFVSRDDDRYRMPRVPIGPGTGTMKLFAKLIAHP